MLIVTGSLIAFAVTTHAQTTWNGSVDNDWHNENNSSNGLPGTGNIAVTENADDVVNLTQNVIMSSGRFDLRCTYRHR